MNQGKLFDEAAGRFKHPRMGIRKQLADYKETNTMEADDEMREKIVQALEEWAEMHEGYGAFPGGDPRDFTPDEECSTPEEREAHRKACDAASNENGPLDSRSLQPAHRWVEPLAAQAAVKAGVADAATIGPGLAHVSFQMFGLGTYRDPEALSVVTAARRLLGVSK
jgi:hypothetical protein